MSILRHNNFLFCCTFFSFFLLSFIPEVSEGRTPGYCADCHTMHNSQGGSLVVTTTAGGVEQSALLIDNCVGCHAGINESATVGATKAPYVLTMSSVDYGTTGTENDTNTLAGGNFYWVDAGSHETGHNVSGMIGPDENHGTTPPGGSEATQLTCAGQDGCHGNRTVEDQVYSIWGAHHSDDTQAIDGSTVAKSYRYLSGITGYEDSIYEFRPTVTRHNQYKGVDRTTDDDTSLSISHFCADCHGDFHHGAGIFGVDDTDFASPWIRHPTDFDLSNASGPEYASYNKVSGMAGQYSLAVPVASATVTAPLSNVLVAADDAIVMCLSCHRAHGSPYESILRWNYKAWPGSGGYNGCEVCHTTKN